MKYKVGDMVIVKSDYGNNNKPWIFFRSKIGTILCVVKEDKYDYVVQFDKIYPGAHSCLSNTLGLKIDPSGRSRFFMEDEIIPYDKNLEFIRNKQKEEIKKKMRYIDPFEEENWLEENIKYNKNKNLKSYKKFNKKHV
jgi:hypothetical protein